MENTTQINLKDSTALSRLAKNNPKLRGVLLKHYPGFIDTYRKNLKFNRLSKSKN